MVSSKSLRKWTPLCSISSGWLSVIPARLPYLAREESRVAGLFARQPRARVTQRAASGSILSSTNF